MYARSLINHVTQSDLAICSSYVLTLIRMAYILILIPIPCLTGTIRLWQTYPGKKYGLWT